MNILEKSIELISLYDLYQELLTDKQKSYFESYYYDDYSLQEISDNNNVSRNAVHDLLKRTAKKLNDLESALHLKEENKKRQIIISKIRDINDNEDITNLINELEKVE
ncbi:putative DNA-binding protein [Candidatus Izimaplasma bacterium HR1]|jgi:predicted DNA-binding protein YlxM (UPF0122 family)|uniref:YlxM family DNA-binding protein n=1 Tax=Candidatus Izimoplasma sp. HR1 TaxID=1541959 RepID=UPI0004F8AC9B|nr:putative DNA-binding protein [Candidatus Izimaplasma bacterium HR1]